MSDNLAIGELSARTGRSVHALRYYEAIGLMPFVTRDAGGRRRYDPQHVEWLLFLDRLQAAGMTLAEMQRYASLVSRGRQTLAERIALLEQHMEQLDRRMAELAASKKLLKAKLAFYADWQATGKRPRNWWIDVGQPAAPPGKNGKKR
jgi:DNA-binding transcriptional MerR regulator